jgi:CBS domain-containing membrane protein
MMTDLRTNETMIEKNREEIANQETLQKGTTGFLAREIFLLRRQRKAVLEHCRRIAVLGASPDPKSASFVSIEKLLGLGLEIVPIIVGVRNLLGLRCYPSLRDVPGKIDIFQVHPGDGVNLIEAASDAVEKGVYALWIERGMAGSEDVEEILGNGKVQLIEYESLATEYIKHCPPAPVKTASVPGGQRALKVKERMTKNPVTIKPKDGIKSAIRIMERGRFRHLPVVDENGNLVGMVSDRDIRLIRPSLATMSPEDAMVQLWSISVQQAAVFDPVTVGPDTSLKDAGELMLRWQVGGLPVVEDKHKLVGIITYTDLLREFVAQAESS